MGRSVFVVGGGLIGSSIAWRLAQRGFEVTLAYPENLSGEASPAGAGMLSPESESNSELGAESLAMYPAFVEELRAETGLSIDFRICGCQVVGGDYYPSDAVVDPTDLLRALRSACEKQKVRVVNLPSPLAFTESSGDLAVVIAAGAWSSQIRVNHQGREVPLPAVVPVKGHLIGFELAPGILGPFLRESHTYVLQRANGFVIAGSNEEEVGFDTRVDPKVCAEIHEKAARLVPALAELEPVKKWIGFRPRPVDQEGPFMEQVADTNVWLAYGHYRNGILLTPLTAQRIANEISSFSATRM